MAALTITHPFVSLIADSGNTSLVQPSDWNDDHTILGDSTATSGYVLVGQGSGVAPVWAAPSSLSLLVVGTTTITGGATTRILYDNAGVLGEYTITGSGTVVAMQTSPRFITDIAPTANDGAALGTTLLSWSDAFLALGGVINWNAGDVTLTHAADTLTLSGDTLGSLVFAFAGTKAATGKTTASVTMAGGLGVSGTIYANQLYALSAQAGFCVVETTLATTTANWSIFNFRALRAGPATINMYVGWGDEAGGNLFVGSDANAMVIGATGGYPLNIASGNTVRIKMNSTGDLALLATTTSTSTTTGALKVAGGVGVAGALYVGSTTNASSTITGAIVVSGGLGVAKTIFAGDGFSVLKADGSTAFTLANTSAQNRMACNVESNGGFTIYDYGTGSAVQVINAYKGSLSVGTSGAIATNATDGFLYIPTCAGTPTGVPTAVSGKVAMVFDTTNNKLYIYDGGWIGGTVPGAWS